MSDCPCGSGLSFETCCEPLLDGAPAPTAEALMRWPVSMAGAALSEMVFRPAAGEGSEG